MIAYQFFRLNAAGLVDSAERLRLDDDAAALAHARGLRVPNRVEVWDGGRRVGVVPPTRVSAGDRSVA